MRLYGKTFLRHASFYDKRYRVFNQCKKCMVSMNVLPLYYIATVFHKKNFVSQVYMTGAAFLPKINYILLHYNFFIFCTI